MSPRGYRDGNWSVSHPIRDAKSSAALRLARTTLLLGRLALAVATQSGAKARVPATAVNGCLVTAVLRTLLEALSVDRLPCRLSPLRLLLPVTAELPGRGPVVDYSGRVRSDSDVAHVGVVVIALVDLPA